MTRNDIVYHSRTADVLKVLKKETIDFYLVNCYTMFNDRK